MLLFKSFTILIIGFVLLIKGADFFVEGSSAVAKRLRIPSMIIGDHRDDHRSHGNQSSRMRRQRDCLPHRQ